MHVKLSAYCFIRNKHFLSFSYYHCWLSWWLSGKESACSAGDSDLIPASGRPLEKGMATHLSIFAWEISWTKEPDGLQSMALQVRHYLLLSLLLGVKKSLLSHNYFYFVDEETGSMRWSSQSHRDKKEQGPNSRQESWLLLGGESSSLGPTQRGLSLSGSVGVSGGVPAETWSSWLDVSGYT